jgi:hypothetical protein
VSDLRAQRAAENENVFRRINERVEAVSADADELLLVCECSASDCVQRLAGVTAPEYETVRSHGDRFLVVPGHERPDVEVVVDVRSGFLVVEKRGDAAETALADDPRSA